VKKIMTIAMCFLFVLGFAGLSFAQEKADPKVIAVEEDEVVAKDKKGDTLEEDVVIEDALVEDESGKSAVEEVIVDEVVVKDKSGKTIAGEITVGADVTPVPEVTTAATTSAADIK